MARTRTTDRPLAVYGANAVLGVLRSGVPVSYVAVGEGRGSEALHAAAGERGVRVRVEERRHLDELAGSRDHQGVVAVGVSFRYAPLEEVLAPGVRGAVLLDGVQDPHNLGAIIRTARAAGLGAVVVPQDRSARVTGAVAAAAAGTLFDIVVCRVTNLVRSMEAMKKEGFWMVGLVPGEGRNLFALEPLDRPGLVVGGEGEGVRPLVRRACDFEVSIPMAPGVDSLNVSVAAGVAAFHLSPLPRGAL